MNPHFKLKPLTLTISTVIILSTAGLTGCDDDNDDINVNNDPVKQELGDYSLVKAESDDTFLAYYSSALSNSQSQPTPQPDVNTPTTDNAGEGTIGGKGDKISNTNLIEAGVDEVDYAKQDATHIYTSSQGYHNKTNDNIKVYAKPSTEAIAEIDLGKSAHLKGFFLKSNNLYNVRQLTNGANGWGDINNSSYKNGVIALETIDVSNPSMPSISNTYNWQGNYVDSRRIDDKVYVVSSSQLNDPWMCYDVMPMLDVASNGADIAKGIMPYCGEPKALTTEDIIERMPVDINGMKVSPSDCFIPNKYNQDSGNLNLNITLITEVDLTSDNHKTTCISASVENFYMSSDALYLAGRDYTNEKGNYQEKTVFSKFGLDTEQVSYAGSGAVDGHITANGASFSMSEYDDILRVVTSTWKEGGVYNMLHTLKESDTALTLDNLATLPNESQPASIGKPNERIKGVRFLGDEGYVVTFETKDPLYKIDLSDPSNPKIAGELEMPGYSAYLHRINDTYLLGVGYSTDDSTRLNGIQVTVFDTSSSEPVIVDQDTIDTSEFDSLKLAVDHDSRAITTLTQDNTMQLSIPYSYRILDSVYKRVNKAVEYSIDLDTGLLNNKVERDNEIKRDNYRQNVPRSFISDDDIYYTVDDSLTKYVWGVD